MGRHLGTDKDIEKLARKARQQGWEVHITGKNHLKWIPPQKDQPIIIGGLSSCRSGVSQLQRRLARAGLSL